MSSQLNTDILNFNPPKTPFVWLGAVFIAPALVVVLPIIFTWDIAPISTLLAIGFGLLSVLLFVSCFIITLKAYDRSYAQQVSKLEIHILKIELELHRESYIEKQALLQEDAARMQGKIDYILSVLEAVQLEKEQSLST